MGPNGATPIIIGVGDIKNPSTDVRYAAEPMQLMLQAIQNAGADTELSPPAIIKLLSNVDSIDVVRTWTWPYSDLPSLIAQKFDAKLRHKSYTGNGGHHPARLLDEAARRVASRESKVAVITGGEALASLSACIASQGTPPLWWTKPETKVEAVFTASGSKLKPSTMPMCLGATHSIGFPIQVYALYENGFRAHRSQSIQQNNTESAQLYAQFAKVAAENSVAWNSGRLAATEEVIGTVTKKNRIICFPYPLLMNAFNTVNLAAACIITSVDYASEMGIPKSQWIYPLGGAGTCDSDEFWQRPNYHSSPCISRSLDAGLEASGLTKDDIDAFDFYSCFPIVPKLACAHLGLSITKSSKPVTLLGGLTTFGGAGNNYSMHAITAMVRYLRSRPAQYGLVLANGGVVSYQHVVCLSTLPRKDGSAYPKENPLPPYITDIPVPSISTQPEGEAIIETYTVDFGRDGKPTLGHIVGRLKKNNHRFVANHADPSTLNELESWSREPIGRSGWVKPKESGRNLFSFEQGASL
ncbi:hypothetical protein MMC08_008715 [Hypocenomyce scalaris]|nr:hypothetical protein [Hypocenomyce scalaris]